MRKILFFDTETTGLPKYYNAPISNSQNWPRMVQLAFIEYFEDGSLSAEHNYIIKPLIIIGIVFWMRSPTLQIVSGF